MRNAVLKLTIASAWLMCGCDSLTGDLAGTGGQEVVIRLSGAGYSCKSSDPDENKVTDLSLMVFDGYGMLEEYRWVPGQEMESAMKDGIRLRLATGKRYSFRGCVNFGSRVYARTMEELNDLTFHLVYPDDYREGMPMFIMEDVEVGRDCRSISLGIRRMMAKISLRLDRSRLSEGVEMNVIGARIGNCPRRMMVFTDSRAEGKDDCFAAGFSKDEFETGPLNTTGRDGKSGEVTLYMLENKQGILDEEDVGKDFPEGDIRRQTCSYAEIDIEYKSSEKASWSSPLRYRFYLGDGKADLNVERNCHYRVTICPEDDGLSREGWSIDKEGLCTFIKEIRLSSSEIEFGYEGESILLDAEILPSDATCELLYWESSDRKVAQVSDTGVVTATGEGTCTITCTGTDGAGAYAECQVVSLFKEYYFNLYPGQYIVGNVGDRIHIWAEFFPPIAPFDIGYEELEYDKSRGIYDYEVDDDGHGVTLTLMNPGSGIIYMTAGHPINDSRAAMIVVNRNGSS
ncbi:MAG: Ig-like domain-containing protein [Candidatus Cryptobacteroides sp.]